MNTQIDISYMTLQTKRLTLRPWKQTDLDDFYAYASADGVGQMAGWKPHDNKEESQTILNMFLEEKKTFPLEYQGKAIRSCSPSDVHGNTAFASDDASCAWLTDFICHYAGISADYREEDQK